MEHFIEVKVESVLSSCGHAQVGKISARTIPRPDADPTVLAIAQLIDGKDGLLGLIDKHPHQRMLHVDSDLKPGVGIRCWDGFRFEFARVLVA